MSVTIILSVKNNVRTIRQCVQSLLRQSYKHYCILVVDSFSTDGTRQILQKFAAKKQIKLYQLDGWCPHAYNWALKRIKSKYIALIDGDCVAKPDWLKELVAGFTSDDILAVAGYCGTPSNATRLQRLIGAELEARFKTFPEFISRAPTMNLCIRTKVAQKLRFDEKLRVAYDTDFGWRLTKLGKMRYNKRAVILHHHRSSWRKFFKQQYTTAKYMPYLYLKHRGRAKGDEISTGSMIIQPFLLYLLGFSILLTFIWTYIFADACFIFGLLFGIYIADITRIGNISLMYIPLFFVRTLAWSLGLLVGVVRR